MYLVYLITNLINGKKYIGQTSKTLDWRWSEHVKVRYKSPVARTYIHRAIRKHGSNSFIVKELDRHEDRDVILYREIFWIAALKTYNPTYGYNCTYGGEGVVMTEETKEKLRKANIGKVQSEETRRKISEIQKGKKRKPLSKETKEKIRQALTGRKMPEYQRQKLIGRVSPNLGKTFSDEHKRKMSVAMKANVIKKRVENPNYLKGKNNPVYGTRFKHTEKSKRKIGEVSKARQSKKVETEETFF